MSSSQDDQSLGTPLGRARRREQIARLVTTLASRRATTTTGMRLVYISRDAQGRFLGARFIGRGIPPRGYIPYLVGPSGELKPANGISG